MKKRKLLPFDRPWAPFGSRKSRKDFTDLEKGVVELVRRFGYLRVLRYVVDVAGEQTLAAMAHGDDTFRSYRESGDLLDHTFKTIETIVQLVREVERGSQDDGDDGETERSNPAKKQKRKVEEQKPQPKGRQRARRS